MTPTIQSVSKALEQLAARVREVGKCESFNQQFGWHHPSLSSEDLARRAEHLASQLKNVSQTEISDDIKEALKAFPAKLDQLKGSPTIQHFFNGHGHQAIPAYVATLDTLEGIVAPLFEWQGIEDPKAMPPGIAKRVRSLKAEVDELELEVPELSARVKVINDAHEAAENLPVDMAGLKEARGKADKIVGHLKGLQEGADDPISGIKILHDKLENLHKRAEAVMSECEASYRTTTAQGLAVSFRNSARRLNLSIWFWVGSLVVALFAGSFIGAGRIKAFTELVTNHQDDNNAVIWTNAILAVLSVAAPVWFAWISTKQIGQRFRLAEDYAYKAAVSQAYEGFRREASNISPDFSKQLLASVLTRIDEQPLRWVEVDTHGSPWHEMFESEPFKNALKQFPELGKMFNRAAKRRSNVSAAVPPPERKSD